MELTMVVTTIKMMNWHSHSILNVMLSLGRARWIREESESASKIDAEILRRDRFAILLDTEDGKATAFNLPSKSIINVVIKELWGFLICIPSGSKLT